jgi:hypothetical protein
MVHDVASELLEQVATLQLNAQSTAFAAEHVGWKNKVNDMDACSLRFDQAKKNLLRKLSHVSGEDEVKIEINARNEAGVAGRKAAEQVLALLQPTDQQAKLQIIEAVTAKTSQLLAQLPPPPANWSQPGPSCPAKSLPQLSNDPGSPSAKLAEVWHAYTLALDKEHEMEVAARPCNGSYSVDESNKTAFLQATTSRQAFAQALQLVLVEVENEHKELRQKLLVTAHTLAAWCTATALQHQEELHRREEGLLSAKARAGEFSKRIEQMEKAQKNRLATERELEEFLDSRDKMQDIIDGAKKKVSRMQERGQAVPTELKLKLQNGEHNLQVLLRSSESQKMWASLREVQRHVPEIVLRLPWLNPFFGTPAHGIPVRQLSEYTELQRLFATDSTHNRHQLFKAKWFNDTSTANRLDGESKDDGKDG